MARAPREYFAFDLLFVLIRDPRESNPVLDMRFWTLVQCILSSLSSKSLKTDLTRNTWLIPLLNRVPLLPIVSSLLSNSLNLPAPKRDEICLQSSRCLALVWSLAAPKFSLDNLLECFGSILRVLQEDIAGSGENPGLITICKLVTSSLHTTFSHSSNKKKVRPLSSKGLTVAPTDIIYSLVKPL